MFAKHPRIAKRWAKVTKFSRLPEKIKHNPVYNKPVEIYDDILKIEAVKGSQSHWKNQPFTHSFGKNTRAKIYGMPDGSLRIKSKKRLWANKRYSN
jgi:hypothetical protein